MEKRKGQTKLRLSLFAAAAVMIYSLPGNAGDLEPSGPPAPTMATLEDIYSAVVEGAPHIVTREGYIQQYEIAPLSSVTFFTVPTGKRFVLLKLWFTRSHSEVYLSVNDNPFIRSTVLPFDTGPQDFPDRCITVDDDEILKAVNNIPYTTKVTIVGYFYDV